jgi:hypothetical protein
MAHAHFLQTFSDRLGTKVNFDSQRFKNVSTAAMAGHRPVTVLGYLETSASGDKSGRRGDIDAGAVVPTRSTGINYRRHGFYRNCLITHNAGQPGNLIHGFSFNPQCGNKSACSKFSEFPETRVSIASLIISFPLAYKIPQ